MTAHEYAAVGFADTLRGKTSGYYRGRQSAALENALSRKDEPVKPAYRSLLHELFAR